MAALTSAPTASPPMTLVADIGGTNARFALTPHGALHPTLQLAAVRRVADFETLDSAIADYIATLPPPLRPQRAVLAVASPVLADAIDFTNSRWSFSIAALRAALRLRALHVINDFAAVAWALPALADDDVETLGAAPTTTARVGMRAVVGPGTGLGVAALFEADGGLRVLPSEGGHAGFAPHDEEEVALHAFLQARHGRVSWSACCAAKACPTCTTRCARAPACPQSAARRKQ
jgi:glucokinase